MALGVLVWRITFVPLTIIRVAKCLSFRKWYATDANLPRSRFMPGGRSVRMVNRGRELLPLDVESCRVVRGRCDARRIPSRSCIRPNRTMIGSGASSFEFLLGPLAPAGFLLGSRCALTSGILRVASSLVMFKIEENTPNKPRICSLC